MVNQEMNSQLCSGSIDTAAQAVVVIMAGGSGTRFWPLSRTNRPKQFLPLTGIGRSLIQATADRVTALASPKATIVVTAQHQAELVREQLPEVVVLSEPIARNTAPCIGYAAMRVLATVGDIPMVCIPADHMIWGEEFLVDTYREAIKFAASHESLVTIGIQPDRPETGYGYVERGERFESGAAAYKVKRFVEKPNFETARQYVQSGNYYWNSGMFVWRPSVILKQIAQFLPELATGLEAIREAWSSGNAPSVIDAEIAKIYSQLPAVSIDYGVMEKAQNVTMFSGMGFQWSDVGSWTAWAEAEQRRVGENGNFVEGDVVLVDSEHCAILGNATPGKKKLIAGVGLRDLIVVETDDAILLCHRDSAQDVKLVVDALREKGREELL